MKKVIFLVIALVSVSSLSGCMMPLWGSGGGHGGGGHHGGR